MKRHSNPHGSLVVTASEIVTGWNTASSNTVILSCFSRGSFTTATSTGFVKKSWPRSRTKKSETAPDMAHVTFAPD